MRAWVSFGVILYRKYRLILDSDTCWSVVIQMNVGKFHFVACLYILHFHSKTVVLSSNFTFAGNDVFYRMVDPPVTVKHFVRVQPHCLCNKLVPHTNSEYRKPTVNHLLYHFNGIGHGSRVTRAIGYKKSIWVPLHHFFK